ncbi:protein-disulfide reductase DsbD [Thorsellia kenyensis]|uniref:Thiol:disulfide interchange protein DsbD n=1 Tax=Thorsellia kenyensis TaxID=1549888 RepID=A0ABV6CD43_9GAMM
MKKIIVFVGICLSSLIFFSSSSWANFFSNQNSTDKILSVDEAFIFDFTQNNETLILNWLIKPGHYLYQNKFSLNAKNSEVGKLILPTGLSHTDEFFGDVIIYRDSLSVKVPINATSQNPMLQVTFQGCADRGICYPPKTIDVPLKYIKTNELKAPFQANETEVIELASGISPPKQQISELTKTSFGEVSTYQEPLTAVNSLSASQGISPWWAFLFGLGVAFTPCVLPMYPLLIGLISGRQKEMNRFKMGMLVLTYIQGMALSYTVLGILIALVGLKFQSALQNPIFLITIAVLFIFLAGSMFGFYSIQMPSRVQTQLVHWSNRQKSGSYVGVFFMGAIAGLLCSPCTTAPLSAILPFIAESKNILKGGFTLYMYALGMGIPLLAFALFGYRLMPKAGPWMQYVKEGLGFVILALPLFLIERLITIQLSELLWSLLLSAFFAWALLIALKGSSGKSRIAQIVLVMALLIASLPMQQGVWQMINEKTGFYFVFQNQQEERKSIEFTDVSSLTELKNMLLQSKKNQTKVLIDYYADWCTACRQFEKYTFTDKRVQALLKDTLLIRIDVTKNSNTSSEFLEYFDVLGLPALLLIDESGKEVERVNGFMDSEQFIMTMSPYFMVAK